ncbi:MAG TPA: hypothetical protein VF009_06895 [Solirubrobacterales bacterium]
MATQRRPVAFSRFGGLRLDLPPDEVGPEDAIALQDVDWADNNPGLLRPRAGATKLNTIEPEGLYSAVTRHSDQRLIALRNPSFSSPKLLCALSTSGGSEVKTVELPAESGDRIWFVQYGTPTAEYTYAYSEIMPPRRFDGTNFSTPTATVDGVAGKALPLIKYAAVWGDGGNRLVAATPGASWKGGADGPGGAHTSESHVWFSDPGNAESWHTVAPEANYVQVSPGDGERITGICEWNGQIFVAKQTKLYVFYSVGTDSEGGPIFNYRTIHIGAVMQDPLNVADLVNPHNVPVMVAGDEGVYLLTSAGVMVTNGGRPMLISQALSALTTRSSIYGPMNAYLGGNATWSKFKGLYYFNRRLYVLGTKWINPSRILVYDLEHDAWLVWRMAMNSIVAWEKGTVESGLYFTGANTPFVYAYDEGAATDPSAAIEPFWQSGFYNLGSDDEKSFVETKLWGKGQLTYAGYGDLSETASFSEAVDLGNALLLPFTEERRNYADQTATLFSHRITLGENARIGRIARYLRETRTSGTKTKS